VKKSLSVVHVETSKEKWVALINKQLKVEFISQKGISLSNSFWKLFARAHEKTLHVWHVKEDYVTSHCGYNYFRNDG
jgi:hypothetical protein